MKKRLASILLACAVGAGTALALAGCVEQRDYDFSIWVPFKSNAVGQYDEHIVFQKLEELTGLKVKFVHDDLTNVNNVFARGTYCDVMILNDSYPNFTGTYPGGIEKGIADGKIVDISDRMEERAPNYSALVASDPAVKQGTVLDDGRLTAFYEVANKESDSWYGYMMREDWLKEIGYTVDGSKTGEVKIPQTYADWEEVLQGFKDAGLSSTPFFLYSQGVDPFNAISAGYGVTFDFQLDSTGKVNYGPYMEEFEDYLSMMNSWYEKGFIGKEYAASKEYVPITDAVGGTNTDGSYKEAKYGAFTQMYIYMTQYEETAKALGNEEYSLVAVPNPKQNAEDEIHIRQKASRTGNYAVITDKCPDDMIDKVIEWFDYLYSAEGSLLMSYGIEGDTYTLDENGNAHYTEKVTESETLSPSDAVKKYSVQGFPCFYDIGREKQVTNEKEQSAMKTWTEGCDADWVLPLTSLTAEEGSEYADTMDEIEDVVLDYIFDYITGAEHSTFAEFRAELEELGIKEMISMKQSSLDRYNARLSK